MAVTSLRRLDQDIARFLAFKRALGHAYVRGAFMLQSFRRYVASHATSPCRVDLDGMMHGWLARTDGRRPVTVTIELGVLRQLCRFRRRADARTVIPGREWAPQPAVSAFVPHVFSLDDIRLLLQRATPGRGDPTRAATLRTLILILYCTGLRPGEAVRLELRDVDLAQQCFVIRESKGKTRLVPFRDDLATVLRDYVAARARVAPPSARALLVRPAGGGLSPGTARAWLTRLFQDCGLKPPAGRHGPRPYDFRHAFAVHRLTAWYRAGVDLQARLPWLSAYLGHDDLLGTEAYLTATPELLALAAHRFARRYHDAAVAR